MARIRTPPKFALGARVANPLEGRTGRIESFDADTGIYTLVYHDGHRESLSEADTARLVVKTQQNSATTTMTASGDGASESDDPDKLLGAAVTKTVTSYNNERMAVSGYVFAYLPKTCEYRVSFSDDTFEHWSRDCTRASVAAASESSSHVADASGVKRASSVVGDESRAHKKRKQTDGGSNSEDGVDDDDDDDGPELQQTKYPSRSTAYAVIRKVLCVILAQSTIKKTRTEKQVIVLNNEDLKPKRALENFVEAGGLVCLQRVLVIWMRKPATHAGALLILKVLAALPGVTPEAVLQSTIGKTLRGISSVCRSMGHVDPVLGDLAEWIIRSWKRSVLRKPFAMSAKELIQENSSELRAVDTLPLYVPPPPSADKNMSDKQAMTNHLRRLLSGDVGPPRASTATASDLDRDVVYLPRFNSLGSEDARRPVRQTILLDTLAAKINREHVEGLKKQQQQQQASRRAADTDAGVGADTGTSASGAGAGGVGHTADGGADFSTGKKSIWDEDGCDSVSIGRLVFGRPQIQLFQRDGIVAHLRSTTRSRLVAHQSVTMTESGLVLDDEVPSAELPRANKLLAPAKSILKTAATEIVPAAQVRW